jgi:hypothetical protein
MYLEWQDLNQDPISGPDLAYRIQAANWSAIGGPDTAAVVASGSQAQQWDLLRFLRQPVVLKNAHHDPVWWGYLHGLDLPAGEWTIGVNLDQTYNAVKVAFALVQDDETTAVSSITTTAEHTGSIVRFGRKELVQNIGDSSQAQAEAERNRLLAVTHLAQTQQQPRRSQVARLLLRGWWHTLDWTYYTALEDTAVSTTDQIVAMAAAAQFVVDAWIVEASGVSSNPYRDGRQSIKDEIESLLQAGTSSGRRLLAAITPQRRLRVWPEPARPADTAAAWYRLKRDGRLNRPNDSPLPAATPALGVWAAFEDGIMPATANLDMLTAPGRFLTETADYQAGRVPAVFHYPRGRRLWAAEDELQGFVD